MSLKTNAPNNENSEKCSACGGKCCKRMPGFYVPDNFKPEQLTKDGIIDLIKNQKITIDAYEDEDYSLYPFLRPRASTDKCYGNLSYGGTCLHLTATGCDLDFEHRPYGCRLLDPNACATEQSVINKEQISEYWLDYVEVLFEVINELNLNLTSNTYRDYTTEPKIFQEVFTWKYFNPALDMYNAYAQEAFEVMSYLKSNDKVFETFTGDKPE